MEVLIGAAVLALGQSLVFGLPGLAIAIQRSVYRGFDLSPGVVALVGAEAFRWLSGSVDGGAVGALLAAFVGAVATSVSVAIAWNVSMDRVEGRRSLSPDRFFIASLGMSTAAAALIGIVRGGGFRRSSAELGTVEIAGATVGLSTLCYIVIGLALLAVMLRISRRRGVLALDLLSQNPEFAEELGVDRRRVSLLAAVCSGILSGITGCYVATTAGVSPETGMSLFLGGAGAAFLLRGRLIPRVFIAAVLLGVTRTSLELVISPSVASALVFALILGVLLAQGIDRNDRAVR